MEYYDILGVSGSADDAELKKVCLQFHATLPDYYRCGLGVPQTSHKVSVHLMSLRSDVKPCIWAQIPSVGHTNGFQQVVFMPR